MYTSKHKRKLVFLKGKTKLPRLVLYASAWRVFLQPSKKPSKCNGNTDRHLTIPALVGTAIIHFIIQIDMLSRGFPALVLLSVFWKVLVLGNEAVKWNWMILSEIVSERGPSITVVVSLGQATWKCPMRTGNIKIINQSENKRSNKVCCIKSNVSSHKVYLKAEYTRDEKGQLVLSGVGC